MKTNPLLVPKWKKRTFETHLKHLKFLNNHNDVRVAFLGDSMMERWLSTGSHLWTAKFKDYANFGIGGDCIENLLWRLIKNNEVDGILDNIKLDKIIFMIGTNNLERRSVDQILEGINNVIDIILQKQPDVELVTYGLLDRTDVSSDKTKELNVRLEALIKERGNPKLTYRFFGDKVNGVDKFFDDHVHLSKLGYEEWFKDLSTIV